MRSTAYPVQVICPIVGLPRRSYYYAAVEREETELKAALETVAGQFPT